MPFVINLFPKKSVMKKILLLLVVSLSVLAHGYSQKTQVKNVLIGKVINEKTGDPLPGASIYIPDLKSGTNAREDGSYSTPSLPAGKYLIEVSFVGFETKFESIDLAGTGQLNFLLKESAMG